MSISDSARQIPGVAAAEGAIAGTFANESDLPIADYDQQTADGVVSRLKGFSQRELRLIDAYQREQEPRHDHRPHRQARRRAAVGGIRRAGRRHRRLQARHRRQRYRP